MAMGDISRLINTTINKYVMGAEDAMTRNYKIFAILRDRGLITLNESGLKRDWKLEMKLVPLQAVMSGDTVSFTQSDRHKTAALEPRAFVVADQIDIFQREMNKSEEAIVKLFDGIVPGLMRSATQNFNRLAYNDGNADDRSIHGFDSFCGLGSNSTEQPIVFPSDTYAGLSTVLGTAGGGSWESVGGVSRWPSGVGDEEHDFFSPLLVNYASNNSSPNGWSATTKTWPNTNIEALRYGIHKQAKNVASRDDQMDLVLLENELYRQFANSLDAKEQAFVTRGDGPSGLYRLGWGPTVNFEGVDVTSEFGVPSSQGADSRPVGYGWSFGNLKLCSWQQKIFQNLERDWDPTTLNWRFEVLFFGNFYFYTPRFFVKWLSNGA